MSALPEDSEALEALFASLAPPATPADALARDPALGGAVAGFDLLPLVQLLAGIQTDPAFQANSIRFEWATRLALACARGNRAPARDPVQRLLNRRLEAACIALLEDPIEDVMVEPVCTQRGEYLLLTGTWEKAGHYTETVVGGFWMLPDGEPKQEALDQVLALLGLSDALVRRAGIARYALGGGTPTAAIRLPPSRTLPYCPSALSSPGGTSPMPASTPACSRRSFSIPTALPICSMPSPAIRCSNSTRWS